MFSFFANFLGSLLGGGGSISTPSAEGLKVAIINITQFLNWLMGFLQGWMYRANDSVNYFDGTVRNFGGGLDKFTWQLRSSVMHTSGYIIPASIRHLEDGIHNYVDGWGLRKIPVIRNTANYAYNLVKRDDWWIRNWATPRINALNGFWSFYTKNDSPIVNQWKVWFKDPPLFANWAAPYIVKAATTYLNTNGGQGQLDALTGEVIGDAVQRVSFVDQMAGRWLKSPAP